MLTNTNIIPKMHKNQKFYSKKRIFPIKSLSQGNYSKFP